MTSFYNFFSHECNLRLSRSIKTPQRFYDQYAIRGFVYCHYFQWKKAIVAYSALRNVTKQEVLTPEDIELLYERFSKKVYKLKKKNGEYEGCEGFLYCLFLQDTPFFDAFKLLKSAQDGQRVCTVGQVKMMYYGFEKEGYEMLDEREPDPRHSIALITDVLPDVVKYLDLDSRLAFRQTCHDYRLLVDTKKFYLNKLSLVIGEDCATISTSDEYQVKFWKANGGCFVEKNGNIEPVITWGSYEFYQMWRKELKLILAHNTKLRIKELNIRAEYISPFISEISSTFASLNQTAKVENLFIESADFSDFGRILQYLEPGALKSIMMYQLGDEFITTFGLVSTPGKHEHIFELEQWKGLKSILCNRFVVCEQLAERFGHFDYANIVPIGRLTVQKVMDLKEKLLLNPNLNQFKMRVTLPSQVFEEINQLLHTYNLPGAPNPSWARFNYPNSRMVLSMCVTYDCVWFKGPCFVEDPEEVPGVVLDEESEEEEVDEPEEEGQGDGSDNSEDEWDWEEDGEEDDRE